MRFILRRKLTYTIKGDADWAADKLRQHLAQSMVEFDIFEVGRIEGEQFRFKPKIWLPWKYFGIRYAFHPARFLYGIYEGRIKVSHDWNHVVAAYEIDLTSSLIITGAIVGLFLLLAGCNFIQGATAFARDRTSFLSLLMISPFFLMWLFWVGVISALPYLLLIYRFSRFLKSSVNKFFHLMADLGVPLEVVDSH